jgi:MFS transporter, DHA3 family, tetracycline resistance protein
MRSDLTNTYLRWALLRAALARGWWLATALYLVLVADLSPPQLVLIGVSQALIVVVAEVPAGVMADAVSRRLALVVAHVVMGAGMAMTGFVTAFPLLVMSQCLWGLGWAISSGADVAWITDELDRVDLIDGVLTAQGRFDLIGTAVGIIVFGTIGWATRLSVAIVVAGVSMIGLGLAIVARWPESRRRSGIVVRPRITSVAVLRRGVEVARTDRMIVLVLVSTLLFNGGAEGFGRLFERRLIAVGLPTAPDPIVWFATLSLVAAALGATALLFVEARIAGVGVAKRTYVAACAIGTVGFVMFAQAPSTEAAVAGALLVRGIAFPIVRAAATILVNRRAPSEARATVHSLLSQSENAGEFICGLALVATATATSSTVTLMASAGLVAAAGVVAGAARDDPQPAGTIDAREPLAE